MVKYLLSRQNTKPLKGYKMNPDTTPSIFNNRFAHTRRYSSRQPVYNNVATLRFQSLGKIKRHFS